MRIDFSCPWCGCDSTVRGSLSSSWRFKIPCELCERPMIVTWDGGLLVSRGGDKPLDRSEDDTASIKVANAK